MSPHLIVTDDNLVKTFSFNRPQALNALDLQMLDELLQAFQELKDQATPRIVVLKGESANFMAGGDVKTFASTIGKDSNEVKQAFSFQLDKITQINALIQELPIILVSVIEGVCAGYGLSLVLSSDHAIAHSKASFHPAYCQIGLSPDGAASFYLPKVMGHKQALDFYLKGQALSAETALNKGILNQVVDDTATALSAYLALFNKHSIHTAIACRQTLRASQKENLNQHSQAEAKYFCESLSAEDFAIKATSFLTKTKAKTSTN